ncbi:MAG: hypothetical protein GX613_15630 [Chloroflexi bacterium]|nr:hypothetical protein [Chloroflexota bacterium]
MSHIFVVFCPEDALFATQLIVQLQQRGLVVEPGPDPSDPRGVVPRSDTSLADNASHFVLLVSPAAVVSPDLTDLWQRALNAEKTVIAAQHEISALPPALVNIPRIDFRQPFLLAVEELVQQLKASGAPQRPLTYEHPMFKPDLLPSWLPSERCWRDDRLRINYVLPMVLDESELNEMLPAFFTATGFSPRAGVASGVSGERAKNFAWFDPRRAQQSLTVMPYEGALLARYQMSRTAVTLWFPAHYHTLDREAAALFRYLATGTLGSMLEPVTSQARIARMLSWLTVVLVILILITLSYLVLWQVFDVTFT